MPITHLAAKSTVLASLAGLTTLASDSVDLVARAEDRPARRTYPLTWRPTWQHGRRSGGVRARVVPSMQDWAQPGRPVG